MEGRDDPKINACIKAVAHAVHQSLDAPPGTIRVYVTQVPAAHWVSEITPGTRHSRSPRERSDMTPEAIQHAPGQPRDAAGKKHGLAPLREFPFLAPEVIADDASSSGYVIGNCRLDSGTPGPSASLTGRGGKTRHGSWRTFAVRWIIMAGGATSAEWTRPKQYVPVDMQTPGLAGFHVGQTTRKPNETGQRTLARPKWFTPH